VLEDVDIVHLLSDNPVEQSPVYKAILADFKVAPVEIPEPLTIIIKSVPTLTNLNQTSVVWVVDVQQLARANVPTVAVAFVNAPPYEQ